MTHDKENNKIDSVAANISSSPNATALDDTMLSVIPSDTGTTKKYFCYFCKKLVCKIVRHLETVHKTKPEVKEFTELSPKTAERSRLASILVRKGTFLYNTREEYNQCKKLEVVRRPNSKYNRDATEYGSCKICFGFFSKLSLRHHVRKCNENRNKGDRDVLSSSRKTISRINEEAYIIYHTMKSYIFPSMNEDDISRRIRYDRLIILFGNDQCQKYRSKHFHKMIRSRLRILGRFMIEVDKLLKRQLQLEDILVPEHFKVVSEAVEAVPVLTHDKQHYENPANAISLSSLLKMAASILIDDCIIVKNREKQTEVQNFLKLVGSKFASSINKTASESQLKTKREKCVVLPTKEMICQFNSFLHHKLENAIESIIEKFSCSSWLQIVETSAIIVQTFCRRRPGEFERHEISNFLSREAINETMNKDIYDALAPEQQAVAKNYVRYIIRGKKMRQVPVILSATLVEAYNLILEFRETAGVSPENPHMFGLPGKKNGAHKYIDSCFLMRKLSTESGVSNPKLLRATILRKQIATEAVSQNLSENSISTLAECLGHSEKIQKECYRQPVLVKDVVEMANFFEKSAIKNSAHNEHRTNEKFLNIQENSSTSENSGLNNSNYSMSGSSVEGN